MFALETGLRARFLLREIKIAAYVCAGCCYKMRALITHLFH
ncbi:hypothetical protein O59_003105 [Cellvibrio sp. BR]|nr:hypothetical protein O59_003105 [Cellvibrio sp. BR]